MAWRYKIDLAGVLQQCADKYDLTRVEEPCPDEVKQLIVTEIAKAPPLKRFVRSIQTAKAIAELNRVLEKIYDAADFERVWCGI